jgi:hypothetical protein
MRGKDRLVLDMIVCPSKETDDTSDYIVTSIFYYVIHIASHEIGWQSIVATFSFGIAYTKLLFIRPMHLSRPYQEVGTLGFSVVVTGDVQRCYHSLPSYPKRKHRLRTTAACSAVCYRIASS